MDALPVTQPALYAAMYVCVEWMWVRPEKDPFNPRVWCVKWQKVEQPK